MRAAVVPAHNEGAHLHNILHRLGHVVDLIVLIDDASSDETGFIGKEHGCVVIRNVSRQGYGASLIAGLKWCIDAGIETVTTMDGDGQHQPEWICEAVSLLNSGADVVLGNRFDSCDTVPETKVLSNNFAWSCVKQVLGTDPRCHDVSCGFRVYSNSALRLLMKPARLTGQVILSPSLRMFASTAMGLS